jgi:serine protease inhibitor
LYSSTEGNAAVSPVSVKLLLGMVYEAAAGESAQQIKQALNLGQRVESRRRFKAILNSLNVIYITTITKRQQFINFKLSHT